MKRNGITSKIYQNAATKAYNRNLQINCENNDILVIWMLEFIPPKFSNYDASAFTLVKIIV